MALAMSDWEIVRRPRLEPHNGSGADPNQDWRRFVLDQVGYDEVARERSARRADRRLAFRRFLGGLVSGLLVFALAYGVMRFAQSWHAGRFDRYLPTASEPAGAPPPSSRWTHADPAEATEDHDTHVILKNPFAPTSHAPNPSADDDDGGSASSGATAGDGEG
jgi:hypothetical protein